MFSTDGDRAGVYRETLFGAVSFRTTGKANGATDVTMGVENPTALILLFVLYAVVLLFAHLIYRGLKQRRDELIKGMSGNA